MADRPTRADPEGSVPTLIPEREPEGRPGGLVVTSGRRRGRVGPGRPGAGGRRARPGSSAVPPRSAAALARRGVEPPVRPRVVGPPVELERARRRRQPAPLLLAPSRMVDFGQGEASLGSFPRCSARPRTRLYTRWEDGPRRSPGVLAALLFTISPFQVWYAQEARGYALLTLGAASAMWGVSYLLRYPERSGSKLPFSRFRIRPAEGWEGAGDPPPSDGGGMGLVGVNVLGIERSLSSRTIRPSSC